MLQPYPTAKEFPQDAAAEEAMAAIKAAILGARQIRGQLNIPQGREIVIHYQSPHEQDQRSLNASLAVVKAVGRISELKVAAVGARIAALCERQRRAADDLVAARGADR